MADWHGMIGKGRVDGYRRRSMRDHEDFAEEDVWSVMKETEQDSSSPGSYYSPAGTSSPSAYHLSAPRMIPRININNNSPTKEEAKKVVFQQSSAPVNIPDWSKIYGKSSRMDYDNGCCNDDGVNDNDDDDGDDDGMIPPHEWIAMKLARSQISSFSVCEGIGRTLKGRDLSKVRNAILTKTGFLE